MLLMVTVVMMVMLVTVVMMVMLITVVMMVDNSSNDDRMVTFSSNDGSMVTVVMLVNNGAYNSGMNSNMLVTLVTTVIICNAL